MFALQLVITDIEILYGKDFIDKDFFIQSRPKLGPWTYSPSHGSNSHMRLAGLLLLPAGWGLVIAALILLAASGPRTAFVLAGFGVEILGMTLLIRTHIPPRRDRL